MSLPQGRLRAAELTLQLLPRLCSAPASPGGHPKFHPDLRNRLGPGAGQKAGGADPPQSLCWSWRTFAPVVENLCSCKGSDLPCLEKNLSLCSAAVLGLRAAPSGSAGHHARTAGSHWPLCCCSPRRAKGLSSSESHKPPPGSWNPVRGEGSSKPTAEMSCSEAKTCQGSPFCQNAPSEFTDVTAAVHVLG